MDHVDVTDARNSSCTSSMTTIYVFLSYGNNINAGGVTNSIFLNAHTPAVLTSSPTNETVFNNNCNAGNYVNGGTLSMLSTVKPTLDSSQIRFCPEESWVSDGQVTTCMGHECNVSFSLFNRRHHCRLCGRIFCAACCSHIITQRAAYQADSSGPQSPATTNAAGSNKLCDSATSCNAGGLCGEKRTAFTSPTSFLPLCYHSQQERGSLGLSLMGTTTPVSSSSPLTSAAALMPTIATTTHRICSSCYYEIQLVVPRRNQSGELRRRCRGELKMLQWSLLVKMLSYLSMRDLFEASLVSSDFYFISRDNVIWYQYNMARRREEEMELKFSLGTNSPNSVQRPRIFGRQRSLQTFRLDIDDATLQDAGKSAISLHARYNFTQFLDFVQRKEIVRCRGLSSFSVCARLLLSSPLKIAIIGPSCVGKTLLVERYVGLRASNDQGLKDPLPTMGFRRYEKTVHLAGFLTTDVLLYLYDVSGERRFEKLRQFICSHSHAIGLCYDSRRKTTLVEAADVMLGVETALGPQPVVVCGITRSESFSEMDEKALSETGVTEMDASGITVRGESSLQCLWTNGETLFQHIVQALLSRLVMATAAVTSGSSAVGDKTEAMRRHKVAEGLLRISLEPSPLDLLAN